MKVVFDTNVVVSRFLSPTGTPARLFDFWEQSVFTLLVSEPILTEYERVLAYKNIVRYHRMTPKEIKEIIQEFRQFSISIEVKEQIAVVRDPADNMFIECAVSGGADFIISGDPDLLDLGEYDGIQILPPAAFLTLLSPS